MYDLPLGIYIWSRKQMSHMEVLEVTSSSLHHCRWNLNSPYLTTANPYFTTIKLYANLLIVLFLPRQGQLVAVESS